MLDFPDAPADGDIFGTWMWDGDKWGPAVAPPPLTDAPADGVLYARQDAAWEAASPPVDLSGYMPRMGVTDGSEAAAGEVGEFLTVANTTTAFGWGSTPQVASLALPPGDWDVGGDFQFSSTGVAAPGHYAMLGDLSLSGTTYSFGALTSVSINVIGGFTLNSGVGWPVTQRRINVTVATTVYLLISAYGTGGGALTCKGTIHARRAR